MGLVDFCNTSISFACSPKALQAAVGDIKGRGCGRFCEEIVKECLGDADKESENYIKVIIK